MNCRIAEILVTHMYFSVRILNLMKIYLMLNIAKLQKYQQQQE